MAETHSDHAEGHFRREIGLFSATMLVMGSMIGSGIFVVSRDIATDVQGAGWLLLAWIVTGVMTVIGALCYAELAGMIPDAGGQYVYLKRAFSPVWGFLYGWTLFMIIQTGSIAAVAIVFTRYLSVFVPILTPELGVDEKTGAQTNQAQVIYRSPSDMNLQVKLPLPWADEPLKVFERNHLKPFAVTVGEFLAAALIIALTIWNCYGVSKGTMLQNVFTVAKIGGLVVLIVIGFSMIDPTVVEYNKAHLWDGWNQSEKFNEAKGTFPNLPLGLIFAAVFGAALTGSLFSADAWNNITFAGGEVKNPSRTLPISLALGATGVILIYLVVNVAYLSVLPVRPPGAEIASQSEGIVNGISKATDDRVAAAMVQQATVKSPFGSRWGVTLLSVLVMISTFGCINGMILTGARLTYAMAKDGLFFSGVGKLNGYGVPGVALVLQGAWSAVLVFSGSYNELLDMVMFAALLFYALTILGLMRLRRIEPETPRPYRVWFYPAMPIAYVLLCVAVMAVLLFVRPQLTWPGLILTATGLPVYLLWRLFGRKPQTTS